MGTARVYRLRKRKVVNAFSPAEYETAGKLIGIVKQYDGLVNTVEVGTSNPTDIQPVILSVLRHNGINVKKVITEKNKLKFSIPGSVENRSRAQQMVANMKNDRIIDVDFDDYSYPVGTTLKGLKVPLEGYTRKQADNGDRGIVTITDTSQETSPVVSEKSSPNWYLIGGAVVVGIILILAIVKLVKK